MFYHKQTDWNNITLKLPKLKFYNIILKRLTQLKFLGVMIDKNLNWQNNIKLVEFKILGPINDVFLIYTFIYK